MFLTGITWYSYIVIDYINLYVLYIVKKYNERGELLCGLSHKNASYVDQVALES